MKKVLMIAHQFPPVGGSGVQRTTKFVKYLGNYGWKPFVLTRDIQRLSFRDDSLIKDIPADTKIIRTSPWCLPELPGILSLFGKVIAMKMLIPDGERLWQHFSRKAAVKTITEEKVDVIYTTSFPYSSHLLGVYLKKKFPSTPWIADFRDEWTNNPNVQDFHHNKFRSNTEKKLEAKVLAAADCVITNTPVMAENFINGSDSLRQKFFVIPNGYDEEDFAGLSKAAPNNEKFTITYTGLFYGRRKPDTFLDAVRILLSDKSIDKSKFQVNLIGNFKPEYINGVISKYGVGEVVKVLPYMKHKESVQQLIKSDALFLVAGKGEDAFYLGKIFEYMNTGRPIIAVVPEHGAAAMLINDTNTGYVSDSDDSRKTAENVLKLYQDWLDKSSSLSPDWNKISKFERKVLTEELTKVFEKAINKCSKQ